MVSVTMNGGGFMLSCLGCMGMPRLSARLKAGVEPVRLDRNVPCDRILKTMQTGHHSGESLPFRMWM